MNKKLNKLGEILTENIVCYNELMENYREQLLPSANTLIDLLEFDEKGIAIPTTARLESIYNAHGMDDATTYVMNFIKVLVEMYNIAVSYNDAKIVEMQIGLNKLKANVNLLDEIV